MQAIKRTAQEIAGKYQGVRHSRSRVKAESDVVKKQRSPSSKFLPFEGVQGMHKAGQKVNAICQQNAGYSD